MEGCTRSKMKFPMILDRSTVQKSPLPFFVNITECNELSFRGNACLLLRTRSDHGLAGPRRAQVRCKTRRVQAHRRRDEWGRPWSNHPNFPDRVGELSNAHGSQYPATMPRCTYNALCNTDSLPARLCFAQLKGVRDFNGAVPATWTRDNVQAEKGWVCTSSHRRSWIFVQYHCDVDGNARRL